MKKKIKLKSKRHFKYKKNLFFITALFLIIATYLAINYVGNIISDRLISYAEVETERIARYVVNYAVSTENIKELEFNDLFITTKNKNDEIQTVDFDPVVVNNVLNAITETVIKYFGAIEEGNLDIINLKEGFLLNTSLDKLKEGIVAEIPIGIISNNALLSNLGPKLPVKLSISGDIESYIDTDVKYYGINNALITVYVNISVTQQIYMPIVTGRRTTSQKIPIAMKIMQGIVPNCYFGTTSSILSEYTG